MKKQTQYLCCPNCHARLSMQTSILADVHPSATRRKPTEISPYDLRRLDIVLNLVLEHFGASLDQVSGHNRAWKYAFPRHAYLYIAHHLTGITKCRIALMVNKDRTSINHALKNIQNLIDTGHEDAQHIPVLMEAAKAALNKYKQKVAA